MRCARQITRAFALYEVLLGMAIFSIGVLTLGRSVQNCLNANTLASEEDRVRQILANRMSEIQATPVFPDESKETRINTGHGEVRLIQHSVPADLKDDRDLQLGGINRVTLTAEWLRGRTTQTKTIEFYVYRQG